MASTSSVKMNWADVGGRGQLRAYDSARPGDVIPIGAPMELYDDFIMKTIDTTNHWTFAAVNSGAVAYNSQVGGAARITTGAADDDDAELASELVWKAANSCAVEIRLAAADVTGGAFCIGFSDAQGEAADLVAIDFSNSGALKTTASDAVCFVLDPDKTANDTHVYLCSVKNDTDGTPVDTGVVPVAGTYNTYRIEFNSSGDVEAYIDGVLVGQLSAAITTTDLLCTYVGVINREGAANTWDIDYIRAWQWRA